MCEKKLDITQIVRKEFKSRCEQIKVEKKRKKGYQGMKNEVEERK